MSRNAAWVALALATVASGSSSAHARQNEPAVASDARLAVASERIDPEPGEPVSAEPRDNVVAEAPRPWSQSKRARKHPPLPAPSDAQQGALERLEREAAEWEAGARDYRSTLTLVVRHHYEEQRRRILEQLDVEIDRERQQLQTNREGAIERLEKFIARYSGDNADERATPDAMFRLAALYEERARSDFDADLARELEPAIDLYRQIVAGFPQYEELAGVSYYLGHAYMDAGRLDEGQQAWRSLVCASRYRVGSDLSQKTLPIEPLPQDHDERFWNDWYNKNPIPLDQTPGFDRSASNAIGVEREELGYRDPYTRCDPIPQRTEPGREPRYLAEAWWQLGNFHFDQLGGGGPYSLNRAMSAYERSMEFKKPPLYGVAMYKRAWTYFKQQRYRTAVDWFVNLLHYADQQEAETGDPGADFRAEAYTYIAGSLTYVDFAGPPPGDPYIPRNDVLDVELDPVVAEEKMAVAIERVQDPALIPQDKSWTVEIYKALGVEFVDISQHRNAVAIMELTLRRFPLDRDAPKMQDQVATLYDQLGRLAPDGSAVRTEYARKALEARTRLAAYVGATEWTNANRTDPEALLQAESLAKRGLQRAAADHTNRARALVGRAQQASSEATQRALLERAIEGYRMAETGWAAYIQQAPAALDSYESRFWLADARYWIVVLQANLGRTPLPNEIRAARAASIDVRDSTEDDRYLQPSAFYLVSMSDALLRDAYREFADSGGAHGIEPKDSVTFAGSGAERRPVQLEMPMLVREAIDDRDGYNAAIVFEEDPQRNGLQYAFQAAEYFFVYGDFAQARGRFGPMMDEYCGKNEWGYQAWEKLISMSNFEGDAEQSRQLAEGQSCAFDEETLAAEEALRTPVRQGVAYLDARKVYDEAEQMPEGPERDKKWRQAAAAYRVALDAAPDRDEAPEAAMNGAYAYKQVGEYDKAIAMYELFIAQYGSDEKLAAVRDGDARAAPPVAANPAQYEERVRFLKMAYDALASSYVLFFDYPKASATFERISTTGHFDTAQRREAARQSLNLAASLGDERGMLRAREGLSQLDATPRDLAQADFVIANSALKQWDPLSPDSGANRSARQRAERQMRAYHDENAKNSSANEFVVEAAYWVAKTKHAAKDTRESTWWNRTLEAFERFRRTAVKPDGSDGALGTPQASFAAEGAYALQDARLRSDFDYDTGHHRFRGTTVEVLAQFRKGALVAQKHFAELQLIIDRYASPEWATAAIARQGSLYDSLRTGLYNTRPPELKMFDKQVEAVLRRAENSDSLELQEKADTMRMNVENAWRDARDKELEGADQVMVDRYGNSITLARRYNVSNPAVVRAIQRLAFFTDVIGEAKLQQYTSGVAELAYTPGLFMRLRPGLVTAPQPEELPPPSPESIPMQGVVE